ncbi:hypothetical protein [Rhizorhapis sp. SPR117]|uniref:hypothetical protein n=1 Tax=Rhizorhapis sp. SPR117 TaxID=2912611 RepID=UPI001F39429A|nr:hypothetical protein [Rhizorhapis sp. SPR117]
MTTNNTIRASLRLKPDVHAAVLKAASARGVEAATFMQNAIEQAVYEFLPEERRRELEMMDQFFTIAQDLARQIFDQGRFTEHFTLTVIQDMTENPDIRLLYANLIGDDDILKTGVAKKSPLNMYLGWYIKNAIDAKPLLDGSGKPRRAFVKGQIIQSYTLLTLN